MTVIDMKAAQQRQNDLNELRGVEDMTKEHEKAMAFLNERRRELVNRLGLNKENPCS